MSDPDSEAAIMLAHLRWRGRVRAADSPIAAMERAAETAGRCLQIANAADGEPVLVLGWRGSEPAASTLAPRLSRRRATVSMTRCMVVAWALLHEVGHHRASVATDEIVRVLDKLTGRSSRAWAVPAIEDALPQAGWLESHHGQWVLGPASATWDDLTREAMDTAVRRLHDHPGWREAAGD
jgi:hypothetical protein